MSELKRALDSSRSEFVIVYGRRRVGKTYLIRNFFDDRYTFRYVGGHRLSTRQQLDRFAKSLQEYGNSPFVPVVNTWFEAFDALKQLLDQSADKRKVIFIDEMPWMDTPKSDFVNAFEDFWNGWCAMRNDIFLVACGSATSWMVDKLVENQGGLHNRVTSSIYLRPFSLAETEEYLRQNGFPWDRYQIVQCYMIMGGIPFYLSLLMPGESLVQNVDRLFFRKNAILRNEFEELYSALFKDASRYVEIVRLLNDRKEGMTRQEILEKTSVSGGMLTKILSNLEKCDFIIGYANYGMTKKGTLYRLSDFYTMFYFRFIEKDNSKDEQYWTHSINSPKLHAWQGLTFELVCLMHIVQIKQKLGIAGMQTGASSWRGRDGDEKFQIDLLIDRADRMINVCEIKFSQEQYVLTRDYADRLRERLALFRSSTKTRKGLLMTMITTFGVKSGLNSGIVHNELTLDDLFVC